MQASGLSYDALFDCYRDVLVQTENQKEAADHIFWLSEGWNGSELFTLPELVEGLEKESR